MNVFFTYQKTGLHVRKQNNPWAIHDAIVFQRCAIVQFSVGRKDETKTNINSFIDYTKMIKSTFYEYTQNRVWIKEIGRYIRLNSDAYILCDANITRSRPI